MRRMVTQMDRTVIPMGRVHEPPAPRPRRSNDNGERIVEGYFAVMTILILGMIVGLAAYAVYKVIPDWERLHASPDRYHQHFELGPHSSEPR